MNTVWILKAGFDYDGYDIVGVFTTYEGAVNAEKLLYTPKGRKIKRKYGFDYAEIEAVDLDTIPEWLEKPQKPL